MERFVATPTARTMIYDNVTNGIAAERVVAVKNTRVTATKSHVANHHIMRVNQGAFARDTNAVARRGLTGNGKIRRFDKQRHLQMNDARDIKNHDARPGGFNGFAQRSRPAVIEIGDDKNFSAASTESKFARAFRARKRRNVRLRQIGRNFCVHIKWFSLFRPFRQFRRDVRQYFLLVLFPQGHALLLYVGHLRPAFAGESKLRYK